jgi:hypothetical protein
MKKIENFRKNEMFNLSTIYGCGWVKTASKSTTPEGCEVSVSDKFNDTNGDEIQQDTESAIACITMACPD